MNCWFDTRIWCCLRDIPSIAIFSFLLLTLFKIKIIILLWCRQIRNGHLVLHLRWKERSSFLVSLFCTWLCLTTDCRSLSCFKKSSFAKFSGLLFLRFIWKSSRIILVSYSTICIVKPYLTNVVGYFRIHLLILKLL